PRPPGEPRMTTAPTQSPDPVPDASAETPPAGRRRLALLVGVVGFVIVAVVAAFALSSQSNASSTGPSDVIDPARFDIPTIDGTGRVRLADFKGKPVVVNFFASW